MLKFNRVVVASLLLVTSFCSTAKAQEENVCYMVNSRGEYINLDRVCQNTSNRTINAQNILASNTETSFLEAYKKAAISRPGSEFILRYAQQKPEVIIKDAKTICNSLKAGMSRDTLRTNRARFILQGNNPSIVNEALINDFAIKMVLAPKYFCPEMAER